MEARPVPSASPWWHADVHADRRPFLVGRARIVAALRRFFADNDFIEVECAQLQVSPGNEAHLHAFSTRIETADGRGAGIYLHTSPEYACKKLLAAGERRIVDFARVFRNRERTALHHPEFTLVEWYRAGEPYEALMSDCAELLAIAATAVGATQFTFSGRTADPFAAPERLTVADAFTRHAGIDLMASLPAPGSGTEPDRDVLAAMVRAAGIRIASDDTWTDLFTRVLVEKIEPWLGIGRATILYEYPLGEAALARPKPTERRVAERFELYACGVELANAFGELTDPVEQRRRFVIEMDEKERVHAERYPIDEDFLAALSVMPQASGIALGLERLVMLATGASRIEQVVWTPVADPFGDRADAT